MSGFHKSKGEVVSFTARSPAVSEGTAGLNSQVYGAALSVSMLLELGVGVKDSK